VEEEEQMEEERMEEKMVIHSVAVQHHFISMVLQE